MLKRLALGGLLAILVLLPLVLATSQVQAQDATLPLTPIGATGPNPPALTTLEQGVIAGNNGTPTLESLTNDVLTNQVAAGACLLNSAGCPTAGGQTAQSGVLQSLVAYIGGIYSNPPASAETYVADVMNDLKLGGAQPAYAQGIGFSALNPILSVWKIMRNIAYFFFVVALLVIGIMIMLRQKIGSQAVITAQQAIPSIIIALITVTFSYAIAGLLIDVMYLVMFLIAGLFNKIPLLDGNVFDMAGKLVTGGIVNGSAQQIGTLIESFLGPGIFTHAVGIITGLGAYVIILLVVIFNAFKLFFSLLGVEIEVLINIGFSPVILMVGAIPGQNPFGPWLRNLIGNLAVFPVILLLLVMFDVIRNSISGTVGGFVPPYVAGYSSASVLPFLAGLGLLLALPQAVDETKKAFGVQKSGFFGNLVQAGLKNFSDRKGAGIAVGGLAAGGLIGGVAGAGSGAFSAIRNRDGLGEGVRRVARRTAVGTGLGMVAGPAVATGLPIKFARDTGRFLWGQTAQLASLNTIETGLNKVDEIQAGREGQEHRGQAAANQAARGTAPTMPTTGTGVNNNDGSFG